MDGDALMLLRRASRLEADQGSVAYFWWIQSGVEDVDLLLGWGSMAALPAQ